MSEKILKSLIKELGLTIENTWAFPEGGCGLSTPEFEIDPLDFLIQAEKDFELGGNCAKINALSNAKRAIISQMDQALLGFGYPSTKWNFPKKVEAFQKLGLIVPRILRKVATARNLLEHEYKSPTSEQIEESLDLASLFLHAIRPIIDIFPGEFYLGKKSSFTDPATYSKTMLITMPYSASSKDLSFTAWETLESLKQRGLNQAKDKNKSKIKITIKDEAFPVIVKLAIAAYRNLYIDKALAGFFNVLGK